MDSNAGRVRLQLPTLPEVYVRVLQAMRVYWQAEEWLRKCFEALARRLGSPLHELFMCDRSHHRVPTLQPAPECVPTSDAPLPSHASVRQLGLFCEIAARAT